MVCDYQKAKIYKIVSIETDVVYIGSTCSTLKKRFCSHKSAFKTDKIRIGTVKDILKYSNACIELIEEYPCNTKRELLDREGEIIKQYPNCVNTQIQGRTMKQYREDNKEKLKTQGKEYREKNKDLLKQKYSEWYKSDKGKEYHKNNKARRNVKVLCPKCNKKYSKSNLSRHVKTHHINQIVEHHKERNSKNKN